MNPTEPIQLILFLLAGAIALLICCIPVNMWLAWWELQDLRLMRRNWGG